MSSYNPVTKNLSSAFDVILQLLEPGAFPVPTQDVNDAVDVIINFVRSVPRASKRLDELLRFHYRNPNRYFLDTLVSLEDNFDIRECLRTIHQQDESIAYLSHQLHGYDSLTRKFEKSIKDVVRLKRQNKRLLDRNKELADELYKTKNNRKSSLR